MTNGGQVDARGQLVHQLRHRDALEALQRDLDGLRRRGRRRHAWLEQACEDEEAQDGSDHAEGIGHRVTNRGVAVSRGIDGRLQRRGAGQPPGKQPHRVLRGHAERLAQHQRHRQRGEDAGGPEQVPDQTGTAQAREEGPAVLNAHAVEEHGQADGVHQARRHGSGREGANRETGKQHRADAEGEPGNRNLPQRVAEPDGRKEREQRRLLQDDPHPLHHGRLLAARNREPGVRLCDRCRR